MTVLIMVNMIRRMKKIGFLLLVSIVNYAAYSQNNSFGILVKTIQPPAFPNGKGELVKANHNINIETNSLNLFTNTTGPTQYFEEFWIISNNETDIYYNFEDSSDNNLCYQSATIRWNLLTAPNKIITGCIAETYLYAIHVTSTDAVNSSKCPEDVIELNNGWHWQYSFDGSSWVNFAANFQEQGTISFKIRELAGFENKTKVYFRAGYGTQFTNILPYDITPCTPKITQTSSPNLTTCSYSKDGAVTFTFERELQDGEQYEMALMYEGGAAVSDGNKTVYKSMMSNATYTWNNLAAANYILTYYTKKKVGSKEYLSNPAIQKRFTISSPPLFSFSAIETQPKCYGEKGTITVTASGGTPPYYYYLNDDPKIEFISPKTIDVDTRNNYLKVVDEPGCIDNTKDDKKI